MILWMIGMLFTLGITTEEDEKISQQIKVGIMVAFFWPVVLGFFIRDCINNNKKEDK